MVTTVKTAICYGVGKSIQTVLIGSNSCVRLVGKDRSNLSAYRRKRYRDGTPRSSGSCGGGFNLCLRSPLKMIRVSGIASGCRAGHGLDVTVLKHLYFRWACILQGERQHDAAQIIGSNREAREQYAKRGVHRA